VSDVSLENITKTFPGITALNDVSLHINESEFFVMLGPTGAGKTTTLRLIAGLDSPDSGTIAFDGVVVNGVSPAERDVAFVFQQYSLYPTMSVFDNLAFPLRSPMRKTPEDQISTKVKEAAEILRINHLLERKTAHLSGGEMQRVSIGRAIVRDPRVFLMDEPLSNLDAKLRESLRVELQHIQKTQGSTTLFVTHDQIEALTMADRIAVLDRGHIIQVGTPEEIYDRPATTFVARLVGSPQINLFEAGRQNGAIHIKNSDVSVSTPSGSQIPNDLLLGIRPEDVLISSDGAYSGQVALTEPLGVETIVHITIGEQNLLSLVPGIINVGIGENINFSITPDRVHCFDTDGNRV